MALLCRVEIRSDRVDITLAKCSAPGSKPTSAAANFSMSLSRQHGICLCDNDETARRDIFNDIIPR
jgi:hypothetical protein